MEAHLGSCGRGKWLVEPWSTTIGATIWDGSGHIAAGAEVFGSDKSFADLALLVRDGLFSIRGEVGKWRA